MEEQDSQQVEIRPDEPVTVEELMPAGESAPAPPLGDTGLRAVIEALIYVAEEPVTATQISNAVSEPVERVQEMIAQVAAEFEKPEHGVTIREVAGGYKMATKAEHHEAVRGFAKSLKPPLKLSLAALETLAVIAYKQPVTVPEIQQVRGVQGAGVVKTLLDRKLIVPAGRKNVIGKPILYKTTKEFLIQFGLKDLSELPSLKEFEEIRRMAFADGGPGEAGESPSGTASEPEATASSGPTEAEPSQPLLAGSGSEEAQSREGEEAESPGGTASEPTAVESGQPSPADGGGSEEAQSREGEEAESPGTASEPTAVKPVQPSPADGGGSEDAQSREGEEVTAAPSEPTAVEPVQPLLAGSGSEDARSREGEQAESPAGTASEPTAVEPGQPLPAGGASEEAQSGKGEEATAAPSEPTAVDPGQPLPAAGGSEEPQRSDPEGAKAPEQET